MWIARFYDWSVMERRDFCTIRLSKWAVQKFPSVFSRMWCSLVCDAGAHRQSHPCLGRILPLPNTSSFLRWSYLILVIVDFFKVASDCLARSRDETITCSYFCEMSQRLDETLNEVGGALQFAHWSKCSVLLTVRALSHFSSIFLWSKAQQKTSPESFAYLSKLVKQLLMIVSRPARLLECLVSWPALPPVQLNFSVAYCRNLTRTSSITCWKKLKVSSGSSWVVALLECRICRNTSLVSVLSTIPTH